MLEKGAPDEKGPDGLWRKGVDRRCLRGNILVYGDSIDPAGISHITVSILNGSNKEILLFCSQIDTHKYYNEVMATHINTLGGGGGVRFPFAMKQSLPASQ